MSIDSYFTRSTKVIDDEPHPRMQSPPFGILRINNSNPCHASNPPPKATSADPGAARQLPPIPVTNPSIRVGQRGGEGEEGEQRTKGSGSTKKRTPYSGDGAHASLDPDKTLSTRPMADSDDNSVFADSSQAPHGEAESEGEEEVIAAAPAVKKR